jgi:coenzyme F420-0:L-glutamate ligase/coenzyme F420-1:gamma-L-glutamate ligase
MNLETSFRQTLLEIVRGRRSIRRYQSRPVPEKVVADLLEAAIWAPSAHNRQPWRMAVLQSTESLSDLAAAMGTQLAADLRADGVSERDIQADVERSYERISGASAAIVLCLTMVDMDAYTDPGRQRTERDMAIQSVAMAGQNLLLMAAASGLGACWMCAPLFCPSVVANTLNLASDWEPQALITLGFPSEKREKTREPIETRVVWR